MSNPTYVAKSRADGSILVEQVSGEPLGVLARLQLAATVELFANGKLEPEEPKAARLAAIREVREWAKDNVEKMPRPSLYVSAFADLLAKLDEMERG